MGTSAPPKASFDLVGSYARRRGSDVEVVLAEPQLAVTGKATVLLVREGRVVEAHGEIVDQSTGRRLVARAPRGQLADGRWALRLKQDDGEDIRLNARLLVQGERPLVLLWGASNKAFLKPESKQPLSAGRRRAVAGAGKALDRALTMLPPGPAQKVRSTVRRTARRVLP